MDYKDIYIYIQRLIITICMFPDLPILNPDRKIKEKKSIKKPKWKKRMMARSVQLIW